MLYLYIEIAMPLSDPCELFSVMQTLRSALKSIDVRTIAVAPESTDEYQNLVTSIFLTEKSVGETEEQQRSIPTFRNKKNDFAFFHNAYSFDNNRFFEELVKGEVRFPDSFGINKVYFRKFDPLSLKVSSIQKRDATSTKWRWVLKAIDSGKQDERYELWNIVNRNELEAVHQGFSDMRGMIENRLGIDYAVNSQKDFELTIPSLASIKSIRFLKSGFTVEVKKAKGVKDLQLNLTRKRDNYILPYVKTLRVNEETKQSRDDYLTVTEVFELEDLVPYDFIELNLILRESGLTMDKKFENVPFENVIDPFLKTLKAFCDLKKFKRMLFEPANYGREPEKIFENAITWLVSLAGYNPIPLTIKIKRKTDEGKFKEETFDKLRAETKFEIGSADIIAYEENKRILLIDCDIGSPNESKIRKLVDTGRQFSTIKKEYRGLEIIPVLVTPMKYDAQPKRGFSVVDRHSLERILEELSKGNRERARNIFCEHGYYYS